MSMKYTGRLLPDFGREDKSMFRAAIKNLSPVSCIGLLTLADN